MVKTTFKDFYGDHPDATLLFFDNDATIKISANPTLHKRTKHIKVDSHEITL